MTGDHEGGGRDIELLDDVEASLPDGWSHPSSLIVLDSSGDEISLGFDEDLDHEDQFEDLSDGDEEDHTADEAWIEQWREAKDRAESLLDRLRIGHRGVAVVGPGASPTLPSNDPWLAFETTVDIAELDSKTGPVSTAIVDGREAAFSDRLPLAVAARLAWPDIVIRLTDDTVSIFDTELLAFVAHRPRVS